MAILSTTLEKRIPFHDIDPLNVLWHGNHVAYMEEAREAFLEKYGIGYTQMGGKGYVEPVVNVNVTYRGSFVYGDTVIVEITYKPTRRASIEFDYKFYRKSDGKLMAEANSKQHFVNENFEPVFSRPDFYKEWQEKWKVFDE